jgi:DMSO/TMAO reductase YedYZ molybdopterin-dependent catalytic subunit
VSKPPISRGFRGRRTGGQPDRIPPGQHVTSDFPVLSAGPTPKADLDTWSFSLCDGVTIDTLLEAGGLSEPPTTFTMVHCDGDYTTNVPTEDLVDGKAMIATRYEGEPLPAEHGGPARLLVPHLYFWKSAKWVRRIQFIELDEPGFWEELGYHMYGDPWQEQRYAGD